MQKPASLEHLTALTDDVGVIQHAVEDIPNRSTGYCVDDVARAFIVAVAASEYPELEAEATRLGRIYLAYLFDAQRADGRLRNFMGYDRRWLDEYGTEDAFGRAVWALGYGLRFTRRLGWRGLCGRILDGALPHISALEHLRSKAACATGLTHAYLAGAHRSEAVHITMSGLADEFERRFNTEQSPEWRWFEPMMTYDNARLCEAALRLGNVLQRPALIEIGLAALDFYTSVVIEDGRFVAIGNSGWAHRDGERARFDQQPLEAAAMIDAALAAFDITGDERYRRLAELAYDWFFGQNSINAPLVVDGGCRDGFAESGVNRNMGAESTLAYLTSAFMLAPYRERRKAGAVGGAR